MKFAIVAVGYSRPNSMKDLLDSILNAEYGLDEIDLIISVDKGPLQDKVIEVADCVKWQRGRKIVRKFDKKQGLRNHILQCGDLTSEYDAVVILEDDLILSKYFYKYVKESILTYQNDDNIAGISLYKHETHPGVCRPFEPVNNGYDVFFMQFAMSWGQCWTRSMWQQFINWYEDNKEKDLKSGDILPKYITNWNEHSWLKYYMRYIVETDKYFVYPYIALSTNASDVGEHCAVPNNDFQVALLQGEKDYKFPSFEKAVKYDVFFERVGISEKIFTELIGTKLLDLYGNREFYGDARFLISTRALPYKIVTTCALKFRPIEMNCFIASKGDGIRVYDLSKCANTLKMNNTILTRFETRTIHWRKLLQLGIKGLTEAIKSRIKF